MGAYLSTAAPGIPTILHGLMLSGPYNVPAVKEDVYGVYTNTTPVEAYRGAGRPEATFMLERMIDKLAHELRIDPVEVRRRNLIPPFDNGHDVVTGLKYDSGNYQAALDKALTHIGYDKLRAEQAAAREQGRYIGIGVVDLRRDLRSRPVAGRRGDRLPGRPLGKRDRPRASDRQGERVHRRVAARAGRGDDVRAGRGRRARRSRSTTSRSCTATPTTRRWGGARTAAGRPRSAARRWRSRRGRSRRRPSCSPVTCSRRRSRTWTTPTASSS